MASASQATSFEFDAKTSALLETLKEQSHSSSKAEVLRKSLGLLDAVMRAKRESGGPIFIKIGDQEREIII